MFSHTVEIFFSLLECYNCQKKRKKTVDVFEMSLKKLSSKKVAY